MSHNSIANFFWWLCLVAAPAGLAGRSCFTRSILPLIPACSRIYANRSPMIHAS
jgi:hypothetical protein